MGHRTKPIAIVAFALALLGTAGCSKCRGACDNAQDLGCATCDCDACSDAPDSCDDYFDCVEEAESCLDMAFCDAPPECTSYVKAHCSS